MTSYIIKSILCSGVLLLFYRLILEGEKMHRFNRFYLLLSIAFSLTVPLVSIEIQTDNLPENLTHTFAKVKAQETISNATVMTSLKIQTGQNHIPEHLPEILYALISAVLLFRFFRNIRTILFRKNNQKIIPFCGARLIMLPQKVVTYTFLNNIFVTESDYDRNLIQEEVLTHELAHVYQKHTLDVLFVECVKAFFWINPLWFMYKKAIQLNHEFLADEAVLNKYHNPKSYQLLLLDKILHTRQVSLTSSFNYSITKKRLAMMTKTSNFSRQVIKQFGMAIIAFGLAFVFCDKVYAQVEEKQSQTEPESSKQQAVVTGKGLSPDLLEEFNSIVKNNTHTRKMPSGKQYSGLDVTLEQKRRLYNLFQEMNLKQQQNTGMNFFIVPLPVKKSPSPKDFELWKNPAVVGVWINEKKVSNKELDRYEPMDIAEYSISKLHGAAKKGRTYKYQLDLTTNDYFDKTYQKRIEDRIGVWQKISFAAKAGK